MEPIMIPERIALPALTHYAGKLPADVLPHLGSLAHIGLFLSGTSRRRFFRGLAAIFGFRPADHKKGMRWLLQISALDYGITCDAVREANRLRNKVPSLERESICKFFRALRGTRTLREYYHLLDPYEAEGEDNVESIIDGRAFLPGGLVSGLLGAKVAPSSQVPAVTVDDQKKLLPTYDKDARELRVGDTVMRRYGKHNFHEHILEAFQNAKWKERIPIPSCFTTYPDRLRETIDQLNTLQKHKPMLIRFHLHGKYVVWKWR